MRLFAALLILVIFVTPALAQTMPGGQKSTESKPVEVTADQSLEWYQKERVYVARGKAKAVRGDMVIEADLLTAHEREKADDKTAKPKTGEAKGTGDIDKMTAEGNVRITQPNQRVTGDRAINDLDQHVIVVTGRNLRYETDKETVTAQQSLEYYDLKKMAVARGKAVAVKGERHVESDILTAEFRDAPNGDSELWKMTASGNVTVITQGNVVKGDRGVYDVARDIAIVSGNVKISRKDGTQLSGDVGEVDFKTNQSRLLNDGRGGRARALLSAKSTSTVNTPKTKAAP